MNNIKLSVAIPTHNRASYIKEELECIIPQLLKYKDCTEIVVSDNASTDNTEVVIGDLERKFNYPIKYKKQPTCIYFEDNFEQAFDMTSGEYVHLIGDDDLLCPDFYDILFKMLPENYGMINFNRLAGDKNCSNNVLYEKIFKGDKVVTDSSEFAKYVLWRPGFLTSLVFRRDCWLNGTDYVRKEYYGYQFLGRLYQGAIRLRTKSCYYYYPLIIMRNQVREWSTQWSLFWFVGLSNIFKDLEPLAPGIFNEWMNRLQSDNSVGGLLISITSDQKFYKEKQQEFLPYLSNKQRIAYKVFVNFKPAKLLNYFYRGVLRIKRSL